jgi:hypothetical protein
MVKEARLNRLYLLSSQRLTLVINTLLGFEGFVLIIQTYAWLIAHFLLEKSEQLVMFI